MNILNLATESTLSQGMTSVKNAVIHFASLVLQRFFPNISSIADVETELSAKLRGINRALVKKNVQPASDYADIASKIEAISTGGTPHPAFRFLPAAVTVTNGVFTLLYEGDAPQNAPTTASVKTDIKGTNQTGLSYTVSYSGGVATFTLTGTADGVYTQAVSAVIVLGDYAVPVSATGLPVKYAPFIEQPVPIFAQVLEWDYTAANTVDFSAYVYPKNVSPQVDYGDGYDYAIDVYVYRDDDTIGGMVFLDSYVLTQENHFTLTVPANTFTSGNSYRFEIQSSSALLSDSPYGDSNAEIVVYEQEVQA